MACTKNCNIAPQRLLYYNFFYGIIVLKTYCYIAALIFFVTGTANFFYFC